MKVWVYVEGKSDCLALDELWADWKRRLSASGWGMAAIPLENKGRYLRKIGPRAAEKLAAQAKDIVIGLPDFYPNQPDAGRPYGHVSLSDLRALQTRLVQDGLVQTQGISARDVERHLDRFFASALKHDLEMLLLAAKDRLRAVLGTKDKLGGWRLPPEEQNLAKPPKRIVEDLFRTRSAGHKSYKDTLHAPAVLRQVQDLREVLFGDGGMVNCPVFREMLDWVGARTGVPAYQ